MGDIPSLLLVAFSFPCSFRNVFVGDMAAPRFVNAGAFPHSPGNRMVLAETRQIGDVVLLRYELGRSPGA